MTRQRGHGVRLGFGEGHAVVRTVRAASEPAVELAEWEVS